MYKILWCYNHGKMNGNLKYMFTIILTQVEASEALTILTTSKDESGLILLLLSDDRAVDVFPAYLAQRARHT